MGRDVVLVASADETAFGVRALLGGARSWRRRRRRPSRSPPVRVLGRRRGRSARLGRRLLGPELDDVAAVLVGLSLTVLGCSRQLPGPGRAVQRLPRAGRDHPSWSTSATGTWPTSSATSSSTSSTPSCSPTPTPTTGSTSPACAIAHSRTGSAASTSRCWGTAENRRHGATVVAGQSSRPSTGPSSATATSSRSGTSRFRIDRTDHYVETLAVRVDGARRGVARVLGRHRAGVVARAQLGTGADLGPGRGDRTAPTTSARASCTCRRRQAGRHGPRRPASGRLVLTHLVARRPTPRRTPATARPPTVRRSSRHRRVPLHTRGSPL